MTPPDLDRLAEVRSELLAEPPEDSFRRRGWERGVWLLAQVDALSKELAQAKLDLDIAQGAHEHDCGIFQERWCTCRVAPALVDAVAMERVAYRTKDHPEANGRQPVAGEQAWTLTFPLEDGTTLTLLVGKKGRAAMLNMMHQEAADDAIDDAARATRTDAVKMCVCDHEWYAHFDHQPSSCKRCGCVNPTFRRATRTAEVAAAVERVIEAAEKALDTYSRETLAGGVSLGTEHAMATLNHMLTELRTEKGTPA